MKMIFLKTFQHDYSRAERHEQHRIVGSNGPAHPAASAFTDGGCRHAHVFVSCSHAHFGLSCSALDNFLERNSAFAATREPCGSAAF